MTPHELYIENQAYELRFRRDNVINLYTYNTIAGFLGGTTLNYDELLGYKTLKDYKLKTMDDFRDENGKLNTEEWNKYLIEVVRPAKKELGVD